jgi:hypothetical protein
VGSGRSAAIQAARSVLVDLDEDVRELLEHGDAGLQPAVELRDGGPFGLKSHQHELLLRTRALKQRGRRDAELLGDHGYGGLGAAVEEYLAGRYADLAIANLSTSSHRRA